MASFFHAGVLMTSYEEPQNKRFKDFFKVLSLSLARDGLPYISTMEARKVSAALLAVWRFEGDADKQRLLRQLALLNASYHGGKNQWCNGVAVDLCGDQFALLVISLAVGWAVCYLQSAAAAPQQGGRGTELQLIIKHSTALRVAAGCWGLLQAPAALHAAWCCNAALAKVADVITFVITLHADFTTVTL
jgi:hypothetical protein